MHFLEDKRLYTDIDYCLEYLRTLKACSEEDADASPKELFHFYWYGDFTVQQALSVKSFLATQNMDKAELILWFDSESGPGGKFSNYEDNPYLQPLLPLVSVRKFSLLKTLQGEVAPSGLLSGAKKFNLLKTTLKVGAFNLRSKLGWPVHGGSIIDRSDLCRLLILYKYGGFYCDLDVLFLRDFRILLDSFPSSEFCYAWSGHPWCNNALIKVNRRSDNVKKLIYRGLSLSIFHPRRLWRYDDCGEISMLCLPCTFFDPLWLKHDEFCLNSDAATFDRFEDFFKPVTMASFSLHQFFAGAFAYHWHFSGSDKEELPLNSYVGRFNTEIDDLLRAKYGIDPKG